MSEYLTFLKKWQRADQWVSISVARPLPSTLAARY